VTKYLNKTFDTSLKANATTYFKRFSRASGTTYENTTNGIPTSEGDFTIVDPPTFGLYLPSGTTISTDASFIQIDGNAYDFVNEPTITVFHNGNIVADNKIEVGEFKIEASASSYSIQLQTDEYITITWTVYGYSNRMQQGKTITTEVNRLLSAGVTRRSHEAQKYTLDTAFAEKYKDVEAPEFAFTNSTLLDALFQIGGAIHAIPRLRVKGVETATSDDLALEVTFDDLGGKEEIGDKMPQWVSEDVTIDINDFCDTLDSPAQNLVNSVDIDKGCISDFGQQFITVRTENSQVEISADTMAIRVGMPIKQLVKLEVIYDKDNYPNPTDITPYAYEMAEYNTLSTLYTSTFPYSKGYALCYSIGGNTITGLNNKQTTPTVLDNLTEQYAIVNILNAVRGTNYVNEGFDYINLAFRVTYVPIVSARVTQKKPYKTETDGNTLFYNQGANLVETSAYGQKMRGAIARLGLTATRRTYDFFSFADLPKVGQKINGEYIVQVDCAYYPTKVRATLLLTPNFNQISQYVGLNTNYRLYDVSERQTVDRFLTYGEVVEVGDNVQVHDSNAIFRTSRLQEIIQFMLANNGRSYSRIDTAMTISYDENGDEIADSAVLLPVASFAFGQSLAFVMSYLDNYGVGYQAIDKFSAVPDDPSKSDYKRIQRLVPYANGVGEIEELAVFWGSGKVWNNVSQIGDNLQSALYPKATETTKEYYTGDGSFMQAKNLRFVVKKDSAEKIGLAYQVHFQGNRETIVIGKALTENCPLVANVSYPLTHTAYCFDYELNNLAEVDLTDATATSYTIENTARGVVLTPTITSGAKSWAIVDDKNNIYVGENRPSDGEFKPIFITI
ncbi:MAG: hypothetical protein IKA59_00825, partial [Clostridia bacterium]|nr:hypothetical protein [Clostridia bacterium]